MPEWEIIGGMLDMIEQAWNAGNPWSNAKLTRESGRYLPPVAAKRFEGLTETMASRLISSWLEEGHVETKLCDRHTKTKGLRVVRRFDRAR